jgi:hypothetical protein
MLTRSRQWMLEPSQRTSIVSEIARERPDRPRLESFGCRNDRSSWNGRRESVSAASGLDVHSRVRFHEYSRWGNGDGMEDSWRRVFEPESAWASTADHWRSKTKREVSFEQSLDSSGARRGMRDGAGSG